MFLFPSHDQYVDNLKIIEKKNEEEQKEITKEMTKMDADKQKHDMKIKQKVDWEPPK